MGNSVVKRTVFVQSTDPLCLPFKVRVYGSNPTCGDLMDAITKKLGKLHSVRYGRGSPERLFPPTAGSPPYDSLNPLTIVDPIPGSIGDSAANPIFFSDSQELMKRVLFVIAKLVGRKYGNGTVDDELQTVLRMF